MQEGRKIEAEISKGVRKICGLSPALFNSHIEEATKEI
jgi:hypothetical protein